MDLKLRILYVTYGLPYPPDSGARLRDFNLLRQVARRYAVFVLSLLESPAEVEHVPGLRPYCEAVEVVVPRPRSAGAQLTAVLRAFLAARPLATAPFFHDELACRLRRLVVNRAIDVVQIEHSILAPYVEAVPRGGGCKTILSLHNLGVQQYRSMLQMSVSWPERLLYLLKWLAMLRWEARLAERFDHCLLVSPEERRHLQASRPDVPLTVIENGVDTTRYQPLAEPPCGNDLLFLGTLGYRPNADAVLHFCDAILPRIRSRVPDARLVVVGNTHGARLDRLAGRPGVVITGKVPDVLPYYRGARLCVVPLRAGGGTRLKILEAMALGRPVVSTRLGCAGLEAADERHLLIGDAPGDFADRVLRLLGNQELRGRLARQARQLVETRYDWSIIGSKLLEVYHGLAEPIAAGAPASERVA
jgi:sugar transferase (PEP-CTERM/EpsH1 system associated)